MLACFSEIGVAYDGSDFIILDGREENSNIWPQIGQQFD